MKKSFIKWAILGVALILVSIIGINAIIINNNGIFKYKAIPAIAPPKSKDPVSPINTLAGWRLNIKNPKQAPIKIVPANVTSLIPNIILIDTRQVKIIVVTLVDNPSIPSVKLTAFVVPNKTNIANGIYNQIGNVIYSFKIGI